MRYLDNITTTVGQVVKDLEVIVKSHPDEKPHWDVSYVNYPTGIKFLKNLGVFVLESSEDDDALTVKELLGKLKDEDPEQKIVAQECWKLLNIKHDDGWDQGYDCDKSAVIIVDKEDDSVVAGTDEKDIRLCSRASLKKEMKERFGDCPDLKIVCLCGDVYHNLSRYYDYDEDDNFGCEFLTYGEADDAIKVSDFLSLKAGGCKGVAIGDNYVLNTIDVDENGNSFFKTNIDGEDVIACRLGGIIASNDMATIIESQGHMTADDIIDYLKHKYIPELKNEIEEDEEITERDEDDFDCEFEDAEYVECIARAEGSASAREEVVRELESLLKIIGRFPDDKSIVEDDEGDEDDCYDEEDEGWDEEDEFDDED